MTDQSAAAGHVAAASSDIETCLGLNHSLKSDLGQYLGAIDSLADIVGQVGAGLEGTNIQREAAIGETAEEAQNHVTAADETAHFEETQNALQALEHVKDSAQGGTSVLQEAKEAAAVAYRALEELTGAIQAVYAQSDEVDVSLLSAVSNVEQLGQRLNVG
jgi:methyl-accepting chemotaxis protein